MHPTALRMARGATGYRRLFDGLCSPGPGYSLVSLLTSIFLSLWGLLFMVPYGR